MANEWIACRIHVRHKKIIRLAMLAKDSPMASLGRCVEWFRWVDQNLTGPYSGIDADAFEAIVGWGPDPDNLFCKAMQDKAVDWLETASDGSLVVTRFDAHFGRTAKRRALDNKRKAQPQAIKPSATASPVDGSEELAAVRQLLLSAGLSTTDIDQLAGLATVQRVAEVIEAADVAALRGDLRSKPGFIRSAIQKGWELPQRPPAKAQADHEAKMANEAKFYEDQERDWAADKKARQAIIERIDAMTDHQRTELKAQAIMLAPDKHRAALAQLELTDARLRCHASEVLAKRGEMFA